MKESGHEVECHVGPANRNPDIDVFFRFHTDHRGVEFFVHGLGLGWGSRDLDGFTVTEMARIGSTIRSSGFTISTRKWKWGIACVEQLKVPSSDINLPFDVPLLYAFAPVVELFSPQPM